MSRASLPTDRQALLALEFRLADLAAVWRGKEDGDEADQIVREYHNILHTMIELDFHESLDVDSELPDDLMPQEYLDLFK